MAMPSWQKTCLKTKTSLPEIQCSPAWSGTPEAQCPFDTPANTVLLLLRIAQMQTRRS